VPAVAPTGGN